MYLQMNALEAGQVLAVLREDSDRAGDGVNRGRAFGFNDSILAQKLERLKGCLHLQSVFQDAVTLSQVDDMFEARKAI